MRHRQKDPVPVAAAKAGFSTAMGYRLQQQARLPSQGKAERTHRRPDPLADIFETDVVPLLKAAPGLRSVAIFEEMRRRHPELPPSRRTLERWIRA